MSKLKKDKFSAEEEKKEESNEEQKQEDVIKVDDAQEKESIKKESMFKRNASSEEDMGYRSMEMIDSDSLDGDLNLSDCEDFGSFRLRNKKEKKVRRRGQARQFQQELDTNVFKIGFATLQDKAEIATGDPTFCKTCQAVLNIDSKLESQGD